MTQRGSGQDPHGGEGRGTPANAVRWGETIAIWLLVALGGLGLWVSAADPIFGGPEADTVAFTFFAAFVTLGAVATILIWYWPGIWKRWFQEVPPEGDSRLEAAKMVTAAVFWVVAIAAVVGMVSSHWHPVAMGAVGGALALARLVIELSLHHRLGTRPTTGPWRVLADAGRKIDAITAYRRETAASLSEAKEAVEAYLMSRSGTG